MQSLLKTSALIILFTAVLAAFPAAGLPDTDKLKPVTSPDGKPPRTSFVEAPQQALELWSRHGLRHKTLVLLSERAGITPFDKQTTARVIELMQNSGWDRLLSRDYPTPVRYPVTPQNFLYIAHEAGIIDKVYWVPPTKVSVGSEPLDKFKDFLGESGVPKVDLAGLKQTKDSIQGKMGGVPVFIYSLKDLPRIKEDALLMIDISFFPPLYENEVKTPLLDLFGGTMNTLGGKGIPVSEAVVSYSTDIVTIEHRFLGGYAGTFLLNPEKLKDGPPQTWALRSQAMYNETFFQTDDVLQSYVDAVKLDPGDASLRFALAKTFFSNKDLEGLRKEMEQAVGLDKGYYPAYIDFADYFHTNGMDKDAEYFLIRAAEANPSDPRAWDLLHIIYFTGGRYKEAADVLEKKIALGFSGPDLLWALADTYMKGGEAGKASKVFLDALSKIPPLDNSARYGLLLALADAYEQDRQVEKAMKVYEDILQSVSEPHSRQQVEEKLARLKEKWAPFMEVTSPKPH
jgi:Tfp pilus assembly protein PilF